MGQHLNEKNKHFVASVLVSSNFSLWDVIGCAVDEYYLGIPIDHVYVYENLRETFEKRLMHDVENSWYLNRALWEFLYEIIFPAYKNTIRNTVYGHLDYLHEKNLVDFFADDIGVDYEEYRTHLISGVIEIIKTQLGLGYNWLPAKDDDDDNGDDEFDPDFDPVDEAKRILNI